VNHGAEHVVALVVEKLVSLLCFGIFKVFKSGPLMCGCASIFLQLLTNLICGYLVLF